MNQGEKDQIFIKVAETIGRMSTCDRARVGAVIVKDGRCISWGYNGALPGMPHCNENFHGFYSRDSNLDCPPATPPSPIHGCMNAVHAEANAIAFAARQGISTEGASMYCTYSPCLYCLQLMIASGITSIFYLHMYNKTPWSLMEKIDHTMIP